MKNRRNFLQQLGLLSAGVAFAPSLLASCHAAEQKAGMASATAEPVGASSNSSSGNAQLQDIGIQLYSLRELLPKDAQGVIAKVAQAGYNDVETYGYTVKEGYWGLQPKAFKELLDDHNLVSSSGHYDFSQFMRDGNTDLVNRYIEVSKELGHQYLTMPWLEVNVRQNLDAYKQVADRMNQVGQLCQQAGLQFAYHNHDFEFKPLGNTNGFDVLLQETEPNLVKFESDLYWVVRAGKNPLELFAQHPSRFALWHVKDMDKTSPHLNTEIGSGSINYQEIFNKAKQAGLKRFFVEQEAFAKGMDPFQSIRQSRDYVKNTLLG